MNVLLGVCGGIAAYKAAEITRALQGHGVTVEVGMTAAAERFIAPLTFRSLSGRPVYTSLWEPAVEDTAAGSIEHIAVAQSIDAFLIAPASANTLARLAHGFTDDFLAAVYLATPAPVILAPAMNVNMWQHPATRANLDLLQQRGAHLVEPDAGYLACGMVGSGRLASIDRIVEATLATIHSQTLQDLAGETVLITAGGTREAIDPVRFLGNRSSGRMGHALAEAAHARGAKVVLITASSLPVAAGIQTALTQTAAEMRTALLEHLPEATLVIGAAAVADFRPLHISVSKLRRNGPLTLTLEPTPDLIAEAARLRKPGTLVIAFAAETEDLETNARAKLRRKGVDAVVANDVSAAGLGFESERNAGLFVTETCTEPLPESPKVAMANSIFDAVARLRQDHYRSQGQQAPAPLQR